ncbi:LOW QUALITY PROTEIN: hypothetical protein OSB04_024412 [Centaurea solstitialis]|uniref:Integrase catalytic domain-containing protein n=1 Tax=Centaurea solstitialis TaxID=347529 RepID=A0AA38SYE1_9ASTR|nr:LOW QUALITY PROTEIN: hypothetical protein OSB04_024412 [Centaurea solstitialis]
MYKADTRFCHLNFHIFNKLLVKGLPDIKFEKDHLCSACEMGKLIRSSHKAMSDPSFFKPLQMLHIDLCGPIAKQVISGKKYILVLVDVFSRYTWVEFVKKKSHVLMLLINLLKRLQVLHGMQVRVIRSDNGTEFKNSTIEDYLTTVGITHNFSTPRTPQQNREVERKNRTLNHAECLWSTTNLLGEDIHTACYTQNRSLVVKRFEKTPYQLLYNKRPNIELFHVFGCKCYVLNDREPVGKFDPKGDDAIFIGYAWEFVAYRVYVPRTQIVVVSTNVKLDDSFQDKFKEELKIQLEASPNATITEDLKKLFNDWYEDFEENNRTSAGNDRASANVDRASTENPSTSAELPETSTPAPLLEPINTEPTPNVPIPTSTSVPTKSFDPNKATDSTSVPSTNTSEPSEKKSLPTLTCLMLSSGPKITLRLKSVEKSQKTRANVNYCLFACFVSTIEPKKVTEALADPFWRNNVWTLTLLPNGKVAIGTKWVFRNKKDEKGVVIRNKARLDIAKKKVLTLKRLLPLLQGLKLSEYFWPMLLTEKPPGFESEKYPNYLYFLDKALYGLKQAPRAWYERLSSFLLSHKFHRGMTNITLFYKKLNDDILLVQVYVDDIIFGSTDTSMRKEFESLMQSEFEMSMIGELKFFLGLQVKQSLEGIFSNQAKYVQDLLKKYKISDVSPMRTPMATGLKLYKDLSGTFVECKLYRGMIGSLLYLTASRPDIMFATCLCARFQSNPKESYLSAVKKILRNLKKTPTQGLW